MHTLGKTSTYKTGNIKKKKKRRHIPEGQEGKPKRAERREKNTREWFFGGRKGSF